MNDPKSVLWSINSSRMKEGKLIRSEKSYLPYYSCAVDSIMDTFHFAILQHIKFDETGLKISDRESSPELFPGRDPFTELHPRKETLLSIMMRLSENRKRMDESMKEDCAMLSIHEAYVLQEERRIKLSLENDILWEFLLRNDFDGFGRELKGSAFVSINNIPSLFFKDENCHWEKKLFGTEGMYQCTNMNCQGKKSELKCPLRLTGEISSFSDALKKALSGESKCDNCNSDMKVSDLVTSQFLIVELNVANEEQLNIPSRVRIQNKVYQLSGAIKHRCNHFVSLCEKENSFVVLNDMQDSPKIFLSFVDCLKSEKMNDKEPLFHGVQFVIYRIIGDSSFQNSETATVEMAATQHIETRQEKKREEMQKRKNKSAQERQKKRKQNDNKSQVAEETQQERNTRLARERKGKQRKKMSEEKQEAEKQQSSECKRQKRQKMSKEEQKAEKEQKATFMREKRQKMSKEEKEAENQQSSECKRQKRQKTSMEKREAEKEQKATFMREKRQKMSKEQKEAENQQSSECKRQKRQKMSMEKREAEKEQKAKFMREKRQKMSKEEKEAEKEQSSESKRQKRQKMSMEEREAEKEQRAKFMREKRQKIYDEKVKHEAKIDDTIECVIKQARLETSADRFKARITQNEDMLVFCSCCKKILFDDQVHYLKSETEQATEVSISVNDKLCWACWNGLYSGKIPAKCHSNNLKTDPVPAVLTELTFVERRFVCRVQTYMTLVKLKPGDQYAEKGLAIHFPNEPTEILSILPRTFDSSGVVCLSGNYEAYVRPGVIYAALKWLQKNNLSYQNVDIDFSKLSISDDEIEKLVDDIVETGVIPVNYAVPNMSIQEFAQKYGKIKFPRSNGPPLNFHDTADAEALAFPWLFPTGKYHFDMIREKKVTLLEYIQSRLLNIDNRFRLDIPYLINCVNLYEKESLKGCVRHWMRMRKARTSGNDGDASLITAAQVRDLSHNPDLANNSYMFMNQIRGTAAYWKQQLSILLAKVQCLGCPDLFLTLSVDDLNWTELQDLLKIDLEDLYRNPADAVRKDPVLVALYADRKIQALIKFLKESNVLHPISDYHVRVEFQNRGTVHFHMFLWIPSAPSLAKGSPHADIVKYIDEIISTELPDKHEDPELYELVKTRQMHKHTQSCRKAGNKCRFFFPRKECEQTRILYQCDQNVRKKGQFYETKRPSDCSMLNAFNPPIMRFYKANMDIQPINGVEGLAFYVFDYFMKAEPEGLAAALNELFLKMDMLGNLTQTARLMRLGFAVLKHRLMSAQEAAFRICHLKLVHSSRDTIKISVLKPEKRMKRLMKPQDLQNLSDDSTEIFDDTLLEFYRKRPTALEKLSYYEFASGYKKTPLGTNQNMTIDEKACISKRKDFVCIQTSHVNINSDDYYYSLLLQHLPHRTESELKEDTHEDYKQAFLEKQHLFVTALEHRDFQSEIIEAVQRIRVSQILNETDNQSEASDDEYGMERLDDFEIETAGLTPKETVDTSSMDPDTVHGNEDKLYQSVAVNDMSENTVVENIAKMSKDQGRLFKYVEMKISSNEQVKAFVTGKAGTGKSFLLKTLINWLRLNYAEYVGHDPVMVAAPTGLAAKNINGCTLHSLLILPVQNVTCSKFSQMATPLYENPLRKKRQQLAGKKFLIIDEISMVGAGMLAVINERLCQIFDSKEIFGSIHVVAAGDFFQLPPVRDRMAFENVLFNELDPIFLNKNMRQKEDKPWCDLLNRMAIGEMTNKDFKVLESRKRSDEEIENLGTTEMCLFPTIAEVATFNDGQQQNLGDDAIKIKAVDRYGANDEAAGHLVEDKNVPKKYQDCGGYFKELLLSKNTRVLLVKNNIGARLCNGDLGIVTEFEKDITSEVTGIYIKFDDENAGVQMQDPNHDNAILISKCDTDFQYKGRYIVRTQFPVIPAWSVTIHKAQGQSLNSAVVSVEKVFQAGQAYVAFSRIKTLAGVYIQGTMKTGKTGGSFRVSQKVKEIMASKKYIFNEIVKPKIDNFKNK